mgnify:CR=1 FL=1
MKKEKSQKVLLSGIAMVVLFILWTVAISLIDVWDLRCLDLYSLLKEKAYSRSIPVFWCWEHSILL